MNHPSSYHPACIRIVPNGVPVPETRRLVEARRHTRAALGIPPDAVWAVFVGRFIDLAGARIGYAVSLIVWSLIAAGHALARTPLQFGLARFLLGFAEAGNFPAAIKATAVHLVPRPA